LGSASVEPVNSTITISLPARQEWGEGLLHLTATVFSKELTGVAMDAVRTSVHEVIQVIQNSVYAGNPDGMYHVALACLDGDAEIRIADQGKAVDPKRLSLYFPNAIFECIAHPCGGNVIRMTKAA
jgi:hypothetical protein